MGTSPGTLENYCNRNANSCDASVLVSWSSVQTRDAGIVSSNPARVTITKRHW